jgi:hypothetical protein
MPCVFFEFGSFFVFDVKRYVKTSRIRSSISLLSSKEMRVSQYAVVAKHPYNLGHWCRNLSELM